MASLTDKAIKDVYKDLLHTDNSNTGISTTIKEITCGDGDTTALGLSIDNVRVSPVDNSTTTFVVRDASGNSLILVDSTNDLVKLGIGQHIANTHFKLFGVHDLSPGTGVHHPLVAAPGILDSGLWVGGGINSTNWASNGVNPATTLTIASAPSAFPPQVWQLQSDITIDQINYIITSEGTSTANIHLMSYTMVTGSGATAGDLSAGAVLAQTGSSAAEGDLTPVDIAANRASNGTLTINTEDIDSGKVLIAFVENIGSTDDVSVQLSIKYHLR